MEQNDGIVNLVGCQKAEFNHASRLRARIIVTQLIMAFLGAITIPMSSDVLLFTITIIALILSAFWFYLSRELSSSRSHAERLRRTTMLVIGLGLQISGAELLELAREGTASRDEAKRLIDPEYFSSNKLPGTHRFIEMMEESAIWTTNLAKYAARESWLLFFGAIILMIAALFFAIVILSSSDLQLGARILMVVLASLLSADFLGSAIGYQEARIATQRVIDKIQVQKKSEPSINHLMLLFSEYNSAVEAMPLFSSGLYHRHERRLNEDYRMFLTGPQ
ncbi:hypothetical protein ABMY26_33740 [Azospirillum sp. HJ39]|uniref:hypothetical protein n=1 Tax=Azospirillum sp. HJ39 TaxID=3159496 RepID=UPI00355666D7